MKSTQFALFASFCVLVAIAVGTFALITWTHLTQDTPGVNSLSKLLED